MIAGTIIGYNRGEHGNAAAGLRKAHGVICLPFVFDPAGWSCRHGLPGPAELRAVNPDPVHDHGQPPRQGEPILG